jgi:L-fuconolactonase
MVIDAHHHFWKYTPAEYGWVDDAMAVIRRDFLPADLEQAIADAGVDGVVSVQARLTIEETAWLLDLAERHDFIRGVVGWLPLAAPILHDYLQQFSSRAKLRGIRQVLQGAPAAYWLSPAFNAGVDEIGRHQLVYDILIFERQLPTAIEFVDGHPNQPFVLDHIAKPRIRDGVMSPWRENIRELARRPNVYCKLSGMVTEADYQAWTVEQLRPYAEVVLEAFGPRRLMFGSDWPVCLVACGYRRWLQVVHDFVVPLSATERACILGDTAQRAYRL